MLLRDVAEEWGREPPPSAGGGPPPAGGRRGGGSFSRTASVHEAVGGDGAAATLSSEGEDSAHGRSRWEIDLEIADSRRYLLVETKDVTRQHDTRYTIRHTPMSGVSSQLQL